MPYNLTDLVSAQSEAATNAVGLAGNVSALSRVRDSIRTDIRTKFGSGDPATVASSSWQGYQALEPQPRIQARIEGTLLEFAMAGAPLKEAIREASRQTQTTPGLVTSVVDRLVRGGNVVRVGGSIRLADWGIPDLDPLIATKLALSVRKGMCRLSELHPDVLRVRSQLQSHPLVNIVDHEGTAYALFEDTSERSEWLPKGLIEFILQLRERPATETAVLTMFMGEPAFPPDFLQAPDFVPDLIYEAAGNLHGRAVRLQMIARRLDYRIALLGERVIATRFGTPFASATCLDYDAIPMGAPLKDAADVWAGNRKILMQGIAHEILDRNRERDVDLSTQISALVEVAQGPYRYDAEKIRERFGGKRLSDAALQRVMMLAGRRGLMGTSLGSHFRLYERARRAD